MKSRIILTLIAALTAGGTAPADTMGTPHPSPSPSGHMMSHGTMKSSPKPSAKPSPAHTGSMMSHGSTMSHGSMATPSPKPS